MDNIDTMLDSISKLIDETPPIEQPQRFGNQAFRTFYQKLKDVSNYNIIISTHGISFVKLAFSESLQLPAESSARTIVSIYTRNNGVFIGRFWKFNKN